jgi:hypothetical protein
MARSGLSLEEFHQQSAVFKRRSGQQKPRGGLTGFCQSLAYLPEDISHLSVGNQSVNELGNGRNWLKADPAQTVARFEVVGLNNKFQRVS